jgi:hypothetical protein
MSTSDSLQGDLKIAKELVYDKCGFDWTSPILSTESITYGACAFGLAGKSVQYRVSRITPTKEGQFVTIWKRNEYGKTQPFDILDDLDFIIIMSRKGKSFGQFIFPKSMLADKGVISRNGKGGKRGIRVYPPWDITTNRQAEKTQNWQLKYFLFIHTDSSTDLGLMLMTSNEKLPTKNGAKSG